MNILINLPSGFFKNPALVPLFARLRAMGELRMTSHNTGDELRNDLAWADALIMWSWPTLIPALLDAAPRLRYAGHLDISQAGARTALAHGLAVSVSRHGFSPAVSEMALALILATLRRTSDYHLAMRNKSETWVQAFPDDINPLERELSGLPVGLVGFGRVGRGLAKLLQPFGCPLYVVDPFVPADVLAPFNAQKVDLHSMLAASEVVVLCAAANDDTRRLIGTEEIALLRPNAVFINVARAALVDTDALVARLRQGDLFAAIDVFDQEPLPAGSPLRMLPNVYLTPHRAGGLMSSVQRIVGYLVDDLEAEIADRPRQHALVEAMIPSLDA